MSNQNRYGFPAYRVFIFGMELSADVVSVDINNNDGAAPNQCRLTIVNEHDKYIVTSKDILGLTRGDDQTPIRIPWLEDDNAAIFPDPTNQAQLVGSLKHAILTKKKSVTQDIGSESRTDFLGRPSTDYFGSSVNKYPVVDGLSVFHAMDPVRVFVRDPFDPSRWYHGFCGFISDIDESSNENNVKTISIVAEDPSKLFRWTRVFINPGIVDAKKAISEQDLKVQSFYASFMTGMNLPEIFYTMMFGPSRIGVEKFMEERHGAESTSSIVTKLRGIGHFSFDGSAICTFGPPPSVPKPNRKKAKQVSNLFSEKQVSNVDNLRSWQMLLDHEVQPSDMWTMATDEDRKNGKAESRKSLLQKRKRMTFGESDIQASEEYLIDDVIKYIGTHPDEYLIDGGRLMMLIPNSLGTDSNDIITKDIIQAYPLQSDWKSAGAILAEVVDRIQFSMYCTPRGDIVVEPPLFDFDPGDFGTTPVSSDEVISIGSAVSSVVSVGEAKFRGGARGPYCKQFVISNVDTSDWNSSVVDDKVYTMAICKYAIAENYDSIGFSDLWGDLQVVKLPDLIPLYGIRPAPLTPRGYISSPEGSHLYAQISLNRLNADAHTVRVAHTPRIQMCINRPVYVQSRNFIGTTKRVAHTISWGQKGNIDTNSDLYAIRTWSGATADDDPTRPVFTTIGGKGSQPLDYSVLTKDRGTAK